MHRHPLYTDRAELYDAIYATKPYAEEAARLHERLESLGIPAGGRVLEAACGTGSYLAHLRRWYAVSGFDAHEEMLAIARRKVPGVPLFVADLERFSVGEPFDAALCLFSSISYLHGDERLARALACFAAAIRSGGALVIEPFVTPGEYREGAAFLQTHEGSTLKCARASMSLRDGDLAVLRFGWLVARHGATRVEHFTEEHRLWLCEHDRLARAVEAAGFDLARSDLRLVGDREMVVAVRRG